MDTKQRELAQAAADIEEAHQSKAKAEQLLTKAKQEAEDARLKFFAHAPDAGPHTQLSKELLARLGSLTSQLFRQKPMPMSRASRPS